MSKLNQKFFLDTKFVLHYIFVMKNVTITLDEEVARWARVMAAEQNTSVSRLVGENAPRKNDRRTKLSDCDAAISVTTTHSVENPGRKVSRPRGAL